MAVAAAVAVDSSRSSSGCGSGGSVGGAKIAAKGSFALLCSALPRLGVTVARQQQQRSNGGVLQGRDTEKCTHHIHIIYTYRLYMIVFHTERCSSLQCIPPPRRRRTPGAGPLSSYQHRMYTPRGPTQRRRRLLVVSLSFSIAAGERTT